jgi:hypothetical protein
MLEENAAAASGKRAAEVPAGSGAAIKRRRSDGPEGVLDELVSAGLVCCLVGGAVKQLFKLLIDVKSSHSPHQRCGHCRLPP